MGEQDQDREARRATAWRIFFNVTTRVQGVLEVRLRKRANLTLSDYNLMLALFERKDRRIRMGELSELLAIPPSRLTYQVSRLIADQMVRKVSLPDDRRVHFAELTELGAARVKAATKIHQSVVREFFLNEIPDEYIDRIVEAFEKVESQRKEQQKVQAAESG